MEPVTVVITMSPLSGLLIAAAALSLLGHNLRRDGAVPIVLTLLMLSLSLGMIGSSGPVRLLFFGLVLTLTGLALALVGTKPPPLVWGSVGICVVGLVCLVASFWATPSVRAVLVLAAFATALPLFPLHGLFVGAVAYLPGSVATFLAGALPVLGLHGLVSVSGELPAWVPSSTPLLALMGALYGGLRTIARFHWGERTSYIGVLLFAVPWWHLAVSRDLSPTAWYVGSVAVALFGLRLAGNFVQARFGHLNMETLRGLAWPMPMFAMLVGLLIMVGMGLPLFGIFSGFMALMLHSSTSGALGLALVLTIWLLVSWLLVIPLQQLLFGPPRPDLLYRDLTWTEAGSLILVLFLLGASGTIPIELVELRHGAALAEVLLSN